MEWATLRRYTNLRPPNLKLRDERAVAVIWYRPGTSTIAPLTLAPLEGQRPERRVDACWPSPTCHARTKSVTHEWRPTQSLAGKHELGAKHNDCSFWFAGYEGRVSRHFLLMTATLHNGKEEDFQLFMALLDGDRFYGKFREGATRVEVPDLMRHLVKEELLKFDGAKLFPPRLAYWLYNVCAECKRLPEEARAGNELITAWHAIEAASHDAGHINVQGSFDV